MAVPLSLEAEDPSEILAALGESDGRPDNALLQRAATHAAAIASPVIELVEKAAAGVYLTPRQANLAFWGIHVLGVARRTELYGPLLRLVRQVDGEQLQELLGDAVTETLCSVIIAVFDGNADALFDAAGDADLDGFLRWELFESIARLTFDGAIPRERTLDFLDRFERERLAEPLDPAWEGWNLAVVFLGFEQLHDRLRRGWQDELFDETISGIDHWERQIAVVAAMRLGDPGLFDREQARAITADDIAPWVPTNSALAKREAESRKGDPAAEILRSDERSWLDGFLLSKHVPLAAMTIAHLDGYFSAIALFPGAIVFDEYWPPVWAEENEIELEAIFDNDDQKTYVTDLIPRYLEAIRRRIAAGYPHPDRQYVEEEDERAWAEGFVRGVELRAKQWEERVQVDEDCGMFIGVVYSIGLGEAADADSRITWEEQTAFFKKLPAVLLNLHRSWRGLPTKRLRLPQLSTAPETRHYDPATARHLGRKIGRNDSCPCGSGKKFKRCCGGADAA